MIRFPQTIRNPRVWVHKLTNLLVVAVSIRVGAIGVERGSGRETKGARRCSYGINISLLEAKNNNNNRAIEGELQNIRCVGDARG